MLRSSSAVIFSNLYFYIVYRPGCAGKVGFFRICRDRGRIMLCCRALERREMNYEVFRNAVLKKLEANGEWEVETDWGKEAAGGAASPGEEVIEDFIELEQEKGAFYTFLSVSVSRLYLFYRDQGWDAVERELGRYVRREKRKAADYTDGLSAAGKELYEKLRSLRAGIALEKQLPAYIIFTNRTLFEMTCLQPRTMEELRAVYGVGEKNSREYGERFLKAISEFTGGEKLPVREEKQGF